VTVPFFIKKLLFTADYKKFLQGLSRGRFFQKEPPGNSQGEQKELDQLDGQG
jgi:hypothetical protein